MRAHRCGFLAASLIALALVLPGAAAADTRCMNADITPTPSNLADVREATLCLLNEERTSHRRIRLSSSARLVRSAQRFSAAMVRQSFFDHVSPSGSTLLSRVRGVAYLSGARDYALGENIAWGTGEYATPRVTVQGWMESAGHRRNVLNRRFRHIGVGVAIGAPADAQGLPAATYTTDFGYRAAR